MNNQQIHVSIGQEKLYELSIKKLNYNFQEQRDGKAVICIQVKQIYDHQTQFTETNFTIIFHTKLEKFNQLKFFYP